MEEKRLKENLQVNISSGSAHSDSPYGENVLSRRDALKRIGLAFGSLSVLGLAAARAPSRAFAARNLNVEDDPASNSELSSYYYYYYYYYYYTFYGNYYYNNENAGSEDAAISASAAGTTTYKIFSHAGAACDPPS